MAFCVSDIPTMIKKRAQVLADDFDMYVISQARGFLSVPVFQDILAELFNLGGSLIDTLSSIGVEAFTSGFIGKIITKVTSTVINLFTISEQAELFVAQTVISGLIRELQLRLCMYAEMQYYLNVLQQVISKYRVDPTGNRFLRVRVIESKRELDKSLRNLTKVNYKLQAPLEIFDHPNYFQALQHLHRAIEILVGGPPIITLNVIDKHAAERIKHEMNFRIKQFLVYQETALESVIQVAFAVMRRVPIPLGPIKIFKDSLFVAHDPVTLNFKNIQSNEMASVQDLVNLFNDIDAAKGMFISNDLIKSYIRRLRSFKFDYKQLSQLAKLLFDIISPERDRLKAVSDDMDQVVKDNLTNPTKLFAKDAYWIKELNLVEGILNAPALINAGLTEENLRNDFLVLDGIIGYLNTYDEENALSEQVPPALISLVSLIPFMFASTKGLQTVSVRTALARRLIAKAQRQDIYLLSLLQQFNAFDNPAIVEISAQMKKWTDALVKLEPPLNILGQAIQEGDIRTIITFVNTTIASIYAGVDVVSNVLDAFLCPEKTAATKIASTETDLEKKRTNTTLDIINTNAISPKAPGDNTINPKTIPGNATWNSFPDQVIYVESLEDSSFVGKN